MSAYIDFVRDYPTRCDEVLDAFLAPATMRGREVTLMLAIASAILVVPQERIRPEHPASDLDRPEMARAKKALDRFGGTEFIGSPLAPTAASWIYGRAPQPITRPEHWSDLRNPKPLPKPFPVNRALGILRNAMAHGNIFTLDDPIERIVLAAELMVDAPKPAPGCPGEHLPRRKAGGLHFLSMAPSDLRLLLKQWTLELKRIGIPNAFAS